MSVKRKNLFIEFQQNSGDFLKVLGELSAKVDSGRPVTIQTKDLREYVSTIELFWDITEKIFLKYEEELNLMRLLNTNEHAKLIVLRNELKDTYNELYTVRNKIPDTIQKLLKKTALLKKEDLNEDVNLRNKQQQ